MNNNIPNCWSHLAPKIQLNKIPGKPYQLSMDFEGLDEHIGSVFTDTQTFSPNRGVDQDFVLSLTENVYYIQ